MLPRPHRALAACPDAAADDALLEALDRGDGAEKSHALAALLDRRTVRGLSGVVARHDRLPDPLRRDVLGELTGGSGRLDAALRHAGRGDAAAARRSALALIAAGGNPALLPVAVDAVADADPSVRAAASATLCAFADEVSRLTDRLRGHVGPPADRAADYRRVLAVRPAVESAFAGAVTRVSGRADGDPDRAAILAHARPLADAPAGPLARALTGIDREPSHAGAKRSAVTKFVLRATPDALNDPDERIARMGVRDLLRRRPDGVEAVLLHRLPTAPPSVRRVIARGLAPGRFGAFWRRWDDLAPVARIAAGRTLLRALPEATGELRRRIVAGSVEEKLKAIGMADDLAAAASVAGAIAGRCADADPRVRSRAVAALGRAGASDAVSADDREAVDRAVRAALDDADDRVRANAVESAGLLAASAATGAAGRIDGAVAALLVQRSRSAHGRERANAIRALGALGVPAASGQLLLMLRDERPEHRISAMWALRRAGWYRLLGEVGRLARADPHLRSRRYATNLLKGVAAESRAAKAS